MTNRRASDGPYLGPSCSAELLHCHSNFVSTLVLSYVACTGANCFSLQVLMEPKQNRVYSRGRSKSVTSFVHMDISSDNECDPEYVPLGTLTSTRVARTTRAMPTKMAPGGVTAFQSEEERILTGTPSRSAAQFEGAYGS